MILMSTKVHNGFLTVMALDERSFRDDGPPTLQASLFTVLFLALGLGEVILPSRGYQSTAYGSKGYVKWK